VGVHKAAEMTDLFLVNMSIGPVQGFIAAGRRTSDLFVGSRLLSLITSAAAQAFPPSPATNKFGVGLIVPHTVTSHGANKILGIVEDPSAVTRDAETRARKQLAEAWEQALSTWSASQRSHIDLTRAESQIDNYLEFYSAWVPVNEATYSEQRDQVERLLAGRKALRDFPQTLQDDAGIFNSPLDPSRSSVVTGKNERRVSSTLQDAVHLRESETLDGMSLLKRLLSTAYLTDLTSVNPAGNHVLSSRELAQRSRQSGFWDTTPGDDGNQDTWSPDYSYFAVLVADGDRVGTMLSNRSVGQHRAIADKLDAFAAAARTLVADHHGQPIYAGGDDVMALLPVSDALECAHDLAKEFTRYVSGGSLSVGVALCHYQEPLSHAVPDARTCLAQAKEIRNAVCVGVYPRSGEPIQVRQQWSPGSSGQTWSALPFEEGLDQWVHHATDGHVSRSTVFALWDLVRSWPSGQFDFLRREMIRVYRHSEPGIALETQTITANDIPEFESAEEARQFVDALAVARFISGVDGYRHDPGQQRGERP